ncbi:T9SS type A sorting domain-containing protein [Halosquirtibacter xylanolyticus]|uniref:C25 family cysteine peptidase n=1 Tax=Halosquirtibacter xylanolyticus TaxID=3374599 RepID=UPI00374956CB|nr:T9SS type A sorting domain-containing protein [Prolixibacteraceae bacterium]
MHRFLLGVLLTLFFTSVNAKNEYLPFVKQRKKGVLVEQNASPSLKTHKEGQQFVVEYNFDGAFMSRHEALGDSYRLLHIEGFNMLGGVGAPALPVKSDYFLAAQGEQVRLELSDVTYTEYEGIDIYPALKQARDTEGASEPEFAKDDKVYAKDAFYPQKIVSVVADQQMRSARILKVNLCPVQYNPKRKILRVYSSLSYKVKRDNDLVELFESSAIASQLKNMAINGADVIPIANIPNSFNGDAKEYIIITTERFREEAKRFASWKASLGQTVEVVSKDRWSTQEVKSVVSTRYNQWDVKPKYLMIIGDHEDVPAKRFSTPRGEDFYSDLSYVCMDGAGDFTPDLAKGRLSVSSVAEAKVVIDKIINYERNPVEDEDFYQNGLNCAQFQDDERNGYATRRFCHTSEDVRSYMIGQGYDVQRIYYASHSVSPTHFNNGRYSNGEALPPEMLRANGFNWNGSKGDIRAAINDGKFYVLHRDHGYAGGTGWAHPEFLTSDINGLNNGEKLPVVFSINCHTGEFELKECFAEKFLRKNNGGAVAVIAASYYSYSGCNDGLTLGMFESIWPNPGFNPSFGNGAGVHGHHPHNFDHATTTLGDVVNLGLMRMDETWAPDEESRIYTYRLFHLFGDPSMKIWKAKPAEINATFPDAMSCGDQQVTISDISKMGALITVVQGDKVLAKKIVSKETETLNFSEVDDLGAVRITLSGDQIKPLTKEYEISGCHSQPKAKFDVWGTNCSFETGGNVISFKDRSDYSPNAWEWNFGTDEIEFIDGTTSASPDPKVRYLKQGHFTVSLNVTNANGSNKNTIKDGVVLYKDISPVDCSGATSNARWGEDYGILTFKLGTTTISSKTAYSDKGYKDFTSKGNIHVRPGQRAEVELSLAGDSQNGKVYFDFDGDNDFGDDEMCYEFSDIEDDVRFYVDIPRDIGTYERKRIRVITDAASNRIVDACYSPKKGQVEDYAFIAMPGLGAVVTSDPINVDNNEVTIGGEQLADGMYKVLEKGVVVSKSENPKIEDIRLASDLITLDSYQITVPGLEENTNYYYRAYIINEAGISYGIQKKVRTYGEIPALEAISISKKNLYSHRIDLNIEPEDASNAIWGYLLKWTTGDDEIIDPKDGDKEENNCAYIPSPKYLFQHKGLEADTKYNYKLYRYVNDGARIDYEDVGSNTLHVTTLAEGNYAALNIVEPINAIRLVHLADLNNREVRSDIGYHDFKDMTANIQPDYPYKLNIDYKRVGGVVSGKIGVWIDLDHDGYLDQSKEKIDVKNADWSEGTVTFDMKINPPVYGATLIRIAYFSSYDNFSFDKGIDKAHVEDYTINIDPAIKIKGLWRGGTSSRWEDISNWDDQMVPDASTAVMLNDGCVNYPVISTSSHFNSISISENSSLGIADGADVIIDGNMALNGSLTIDGGNIRVVKNTFTAHGSVFNLNGGHFDTDIFAQSSSSEWAKGSFKLNAGNISFKKGYFSTSIVNSHAKMDVTMTVRGDLGLSDKSWTDGFKSAVVFVESGSVHNLVRSSQGVITAMRSLTVDIGSDILSLNSRFNTKKLKITDDFNILSGEVRAYGHGNTLGTLVCKNINISTGASLDLSSSEVNIYGDIEGKGDIVSRNASFTFKGDKSQSIDKSLTIFRLDHLGDEMLNVNHSLTVIDQLTLHDHNLALKPNQSIILGENATTQWNTASVVLGEDASIRKNIAVEDYTYFEVQLEKEAVKTKFIYRINDGTDEKGWIDFRMPSAIDANIITDHSLPYVMRMTASDNLKSKRVSIQFELSGFDFNAHDYLWAFKYDNLWKRSEKMNSLQLYKNYNSPNVDVTCMTQREAPELKLTMYAEEKGAINGSDGVSYLFRKNLRDAWEPLLDYQHIDFTDGKNKLYVSLAGNSHSLPSKSTDDLKLTAKLFTSSNLVELGVTSIYPNPFSSTITIINNDQKKHSYELLDVNGRVVKQLDVNGTETFSMDHLSEGMYVLRDLTNGLFAKILKKQ